MYHLVTWRNGYREFLAENRQDFTTSRARAAIFTGNEQDDYPDLWREDLSEAKKMALLEVVVHPELVEGPGVEARG